MKYMCNQNDYEDHLSVAQHIIFIFKWFFEYLIFPYVKIYIYT